MHCGIYVLLFLVSRTLLWYVKWTRHFSRQGLSWFSHKSTFLHREMIYHHSPQTKMIKTCLSNSDLLAPPPPLGQPMGHERSSVKQRAAPGGGRANPNPGQPGGASDGRDQVCAALPHCSQSPVMAPVQRAALPENLGSFEKRNKSETFWCKIVSIFLFLKDLDLKRIQNKICITFL